MNANLKPRMFQIHLSTAIYMLFAASGLLLVNTQEHVDVNFESNSVAQGWPFPMTEDNRSPYWNASELIRNLIAAVAIVLVVGWACEWMIRLRCHEITSIISIIAAGALLGVNSHDTNTKTFSGSIQHLERGWPCMYYMSWAIHGEGLVYGRVLYFLLDAAAAMAIVGTIAFANG